MKGKIQVGSALNTGNKRSGKPNQDFIGMVLSKFLNRRPPLLVLSDGMGGYGGGEIASRLTVRSILRTYRLSKKSADYEKFLLKAIGFAHKRITKKSRTKKSIEKMGCTVVAAILTPQNIYLSNVGDSRAYLINQNEIRQISFDHSFVAEQVRNGLITELEARKHPKRNILTLSLSAKREKVEPYLTTQAWTKEDTLLLCSDGLWGPVTEAQIQTVVLELPVQKAADKLVQMANLNGGPDNISVIIAQHAGFQIEAIPDMDETGPGF